MTDALALTLFAMASSMMFAAPAPVGSSTKDTSCSEANETGSQSHAPAPVTEGSGQAGVGIALDIREGKVFVGAVLPGTPAAGSKVIKPGDRVLAVGEGNKAPVDVTGMGMSKIVELIRGPRGTVVRLSLVPAGKTEVDVLVVSMIRGELGLLSVFGDGTLVPVNAKAPNIKFHRLLEQKEGELSECQGRIVVLEVWASWCLPCLKNVARLEALVAEHPEWQGKVEILAVSADEDRDDAIRCWKAQQWTESTVVWTGPSILKAYHLGGLPGTFVIDRKGLVVANERTQFVEVVQRLLADNAVARSGAKFAPGGDSYQIELNLDLEKGKLDGKTILRYRNNSGESLNNIRLRLDPNMDKPSRQSIEIMAIKDVAGTPLSWSHRRFAFAKLDSEKAQVEVALPKPLSPGDIAEVQIHFRLTGISVGGELIMLQDDPFHSLDAWYPKAMTKRAGEWSNDDDRPSTYEATIDFPEKFVIASTGAVLDEKRANGRQVLRLKAEQVRGFTIYGYAQWKRHHKQAEGVDINLLLPAEAERVAEPILTATADCIAFYRQAYGAFPTRHLDIVGIGRLGDAGHGSSACCNVITLFLGGKFEEQYRWLVAHEVAHQYFGCAIGLPRKSLGWAPIGLGMMMDRHYLLDRGLDANWVRLVMRDFYFRAENMHFDTTLSQSVEKAMSAPPPLRSGWWNMCLMHGKAYTVCTLLKDLLGEEKFQSVIRQIIAERSGDMFDGPDLIAYSQAALGQPLDWFAADWLDGRATLDYAVEPPKAGEGGWLVEVTRIGTAAFPVLVEADTVDGQKLRHRVNRQKNVNVLHFQTKSTLKNVMIDPDYYSDMDPANNYWPRRPGISAAPKK